MWLLTHVPALFHCGIGMIPLAGMYSSSEYFRTSSLKYSRGLCASDVSPLVSFSMQATSVRSRPTDEVSVEPPTDLVRRSTLSHIYGNHSSKTTIVNSDGTSHPSTVGLWSSGPFQGQSGCRKVLITSLSEKNAEGRFCLELIIVHCPRNLSQQVDGVFVETL